MADSRWQVADSRQQSADGSWQSTIPPWPYSCSPHQIPYLSAEDDRAEYGPIKVVELAAIGVRDSVALAILVIFVSNARQNQ